MQFSRRKSLLKICKIIRLFLNTLTADDKYSLLNRDKLTQPKEILISEKKRLSHNFFFPFLKSKLDFEHFQKKDDTHT